MRLPTFYLEVLIILKCLVLDDFIEACTMMLLALYYEILTLQLSLDINEIRLNCLEKFLNDKNNSVIFSFSS